MKYLRMRPMRHLFMEKRLKREKLKMLKQGQVVCCNKIVSKKLYLQMLDIDEGVELDENLLKSLSIAKVFRQNKTPITALDFDDTGIHKSRY